ncbi:hypothetical protein PtrM4_088050 [Pyrenophora tritici-repentis]|uniref:DUF7918 domain-containing protein n=2 Tax=Pyrenophora tritici-repentis TaxID=45151 RepID=A0A834RX37_9PLEO|nr:uncharacterized protein PTRG_04429 [Pyrenophora tritici-repentis Pt-1C-BFP]EDU47267.1 predicted protein [Pyrenophora tritici-repentis Pt-1C-BFP]KAF7571305.1 hypothetical protein PtrM4_088050 [Pyrenophora tritici-repentis]
MTVIPVYPGLKVEILVNDNALPEYEDIEDTPSPLNLVTKYIEATTGTEFKIRSMINETFPFPPGDLLLSVSFDGKPVKGLNIYSEEFYSNTGEEEDVQAVVDDEVKYVAQELGSIVVDFQFVKKFHIDPDQYQEATEVNPEPVSETSLKCRLGTHCICFKQPENMGLATSNQYSNSELVGEAPFTIFKFKYRSMDTLRALEIVPPLPSLEKRPEEELNNAELQELVKKLKLPTFFSHGCAPLVAQSSRTNLLELAARRLTSRYATSTCTLPRALNPVGGGHLPAPVTSFFCILPSATIALSHQDAIAIQKDYPGVTVQVIANGRPLKEYEDEDEEGPSKSITRYVESTSGVEFAIKTTFTPPFEESSEEEGKRLESSFCFSNLEIVEENHDTIASAMLKPVESLGAIELSVYRIINLLPRQHNNSQDTRDRKRELCPVGPISEKVMKGNTRSVQTTLGPGRGCKCEKIGVRAEKEPEPLFTFRFKYRSIDALKSLGFEPQPSSTTPDRTLPVGQPAEQTGITTPASKDHHSANATIPTSQNETSASSGQNEQDGVTVEEIIAMITGYRRHDKGLAGQKRKSLLTLLKYYENQDTENTTSRHQSIANDNVAIKQEPIVIDDDSRPVKREAEGPEPVQGNDKKRKIEVIVIDD